MATKKTISTEYVCNYINNSEANPDKLYPPELFFDELIPNAYCRAVIRELQKLKVNPTIAAHVARLYMIFRENFLMSAIIINRYGKIKDIVNIAYNYRAPLNKHTQKIIYETKRAKSSKIIIIMNYNHRKSSLQELYEMDELYHILKDNGIVLCDVIKILRGKPIFLLSALDKSGYPKSKRTGL